jgi:hydrogenase expression/formation protein HypC
MCLAIPGRVIELLPERDGLAQGVVEFAGLRRTICLACVPEVVPGDHVIVHAGLAISRLDADEAERLLESLRAIEEGADLDEVP